MEYRHDSACCGVTRHMVVAPRQFRCNDVAPKETR
jgi:hypothetical protein